MRNKFNAFTMGLAFVFGVSGAATSYLLLEERLPEMTELASLSAMESSATSIQELIRIATFIQQHRGLSAGALGGNEKNREAMPNKEAEILGQFKKVMNLPDNEKLLDKQRVAAIEGEYSKLSANGMSMSPRENFIKHTNIIAMIIGMSSEIGDKVGWSSKHLPKTSLLFETAGKHLVLSMEAVGQARAMGNRLFRAEKTESADREIMGPTVVQIQKSKYVLERNAQLFKDLIPEMAAPTKEFAESYGKRLDQVEKTLTTYLTPVVKKAGHPTSEDWFKFTTETILIGEKALADVYLAGLKVVAANEKAEVERRRIMDMATIYGFIAFVALLLASGGFWFGHYLTRPEEAKEEK